ncbi:hypothetical protein E2C01_028183 [Portunus trituberculatus]|uniref:Uncharacterized protein n=1 Tax=Portunus trituberculatus TaxID=210409 RepID=A0A5B7EQY1_PORTR|nr:hypothetical protein [Portunus trituberculatus]
MVMADGDGGLPLRRMHRHVLTGLLLLMTASCMAIPVPAEGDYDLNYVLSNLTALWEEVAQLRHDVEDHRHGYPPHSQVTQEVDTLQHEMVVHAYQRPHEGHNDHHDPNALQ